MSPPGILVFFVVRFVLVEFSKLFFDRVELLLGHLQFSCVLKTVTLEMV